LDYQLCHVVKYFMEYSSATAEVLERYRQYLLVLATVHLAPQLRRKLDPADLVQQTLIRAYAAFPELRATDPAGLSAWLRKILANELRDALKYFYRDRRDIAREFPIEADVDRSASGLADWLATSHTSPSNRASNNEQLLQLANALAELPETMREVVVLKHCQGWTLQQIADRIERSVPAVASYLRRGLERLRGQLTHRETSDAP
jgi:RNA polymerase sigma-70 factor, ECF subfamily